MQKLLSHQPPIKPMWEVEALEGQPWDDAGMFGWSSTNKRKFYPEQLEEANFRQLTSSEQKII